MTDHATNEPVRQQSTGAIWSLILSILGIFTFGILSIPAVICGHKAISRINKNPETTKGMGLSIAGLSIGYVMIAVIGLALLSAFIPELLKPRRDDVSSIIPSEQIVETVDEQAGKGTKLTEEEKRIACIMNMRKIRRLKKDLARQNDLPEGWQVDPQELAALLEQETKGEWSKLRCPSGGKYRLNPVGTHPECTFHSANGEDFVAADEMEPGFRYQISDQIKLYSRRPRKGNSLGFQYSASKTIFSGGYIEIIEQQLLCDPEAGENLSRDRGYKICAYSENDDEIGDGFIKQDDLIDIYIVLQGPTERRLKLIEEAKSGLPSAQYRLGEAYRHGRHFIINHENAAFWHENAAKQGHADAQESLAVLYSFKANYKKAAYWYHEAAKQGNSYAQSELAYYFWIGRGVPKSEYWAQHWYQQSVPYEVDLDDTKSRMEFLDGLSQKYER